ncbi:uncharacterized protein ATNIH1004_004936 [Aspergillus tanneri]|uniref:Uncharacterized protein n=1 Tax=Aspergillus tanneri TaxID=1220188 RepID=A0A5M9MUJ1_9EURO|nr:uncharacterized protein ATNIH1004_004936 [Aspergillus tanneri]KAA8649044.1 hypothetical protein ATNIH1004_004936 [Aspergillus tanneri]
MTGLWTDSSRHHIGKPDDAGFETFLSCSQNSAFSSEIHFASTEGSAAESSQDSVTGRRRHAVYFHRPPVWQSNPNPRVSPSMAPGICTPCRYSDAQSDSYSSILDREQQLCQEAGAANASVPADLDASASESDQGIPLLVRSLILASENWHNLPLKDIRPRSEFQNFSNAHWLNIPPLQVSYRQVKPGLCTRLRSYRDIRLGRGERWAIQEGSLVICIDPSHTITGNKSLRPDEFEMVNGDVYIVCRIYADLWALCAKASFMDLSESHFCGTTTTAPFHLGFIPLCAVTLAANFSAFAQRSSMYCDCHSTETRYPGNGLPVLPPMRSHSLNGSKQVFQGDRARVALPTTALTPLKSSYLEHDTDFVPLDSTLEQILSRLETRRGWFGRWRSHPVLPNIWSSIKSSEIWKYPHKGQWHPLPRAPCPKLGLSKDGYEPLHKASRSFSPASQLLKDLLGLSH